MLRQNILFACILAVGSLVNLCCAIGYHINEDGERVPGSPPSLRVGPIFPPTNGQPWPMPRFILPFGLDPLYVRPSLLQFESIGVNCDILEQAFSRYYEIILKSSVPLNKVNSNYRQYGHGEITSENEIYAEYLDTLYVNISSCEDWPHDNMDEQYTLRINPLDEGPERASLSSSSIWGALRGLETFSQLIHVNSDRTALQINSSVIVDYPRFGYRSLLLDSSRHFIPKRLLFDNLDLMAMSKLNILHWHLSDNEAFPFRSEKFPNLSARGAYHQFSHEYTKADIREVIEYARVRGIRVIPEFDTPGHTQSWGPGQPGLLTVCYNNETEEPNGRFGHVDPTIEANYDFFREFFQEVVDLFPEPFIHLGGDEVDSACWKSNPNVRAFMEEMEYGDDYSLLEDYHMKRMVDIIKNLQGNKSRTTIGWQEVWFNNEAADPDMIVHIWILEELYDQIANVTEAGYKVLVGSCWYLDQISWGPDWHKYYNCEPHNFTGTDEQKSLVLGGGPNGWAEMIDATNIIPILWPRASVPAERLWSSANVNDTREAAPRLEEHRCRLLRRGYNAQPINGAGFCLGET